MKKGIIFSVTFLTAVIGASAEVEWTGHCGETTVTVGEKYFETKEEAAKYYQELNDIICGSEGEYTITLPTEKEKEG